MSTKINKRKQTPKTKLKKTKKKVSHSIKTKIAVAYDWNALKNLDPRLFSFYA